MFSKTTGMSRKFISVIPVCILLLLISSRMEAQQKTTVPVITADSLATGNMKDVMTSFFQLAFDNLTGKQKELKFASNPYAIMLRANPGLAVDTSYTKYRVLRNLNFIFNLKLDTSYKFNGFSSGITYALVNRRDYTMYHQFINQARLKNSEYEALTLAIAAKAVTIKDTAVRRRLLNEGNRLLNDSTFTLNMVDAAIRDTLMALAKSNRLNGIYRLMRDNPQLNIYKTKNAGFDEVKQLFQNKPVWTVGVTDTTYSNQLMFSNISFSTQFLKGVSNPGKASHLEMDIRGNLNLVDDTLKAGRDLKRSLLNAEAGVNWVLKNKQNQQPLMELKFSAGYRKIFSGVYQNETDEQFTLNGTFRIRIIEDIWIPLQFKYDPISGNVFGLLSVKFNFNNLNKLLNSGS